VRVLFDVRLPSQLDVSFLTDHFTLESMLASQAFDCHHIAHIDTVDADRV
jgi:hypothetical protein